MSFFIEERYVNATEHYTYGGSPGDPYEVGDETLGGVYRAMRGEYGRCIGKVHQDQKEGPTLTIGWVFLKRAKYDDSNDTYLQETWITVHTARPTRVVTYHYAEV